MKRSIAQMLVVLVFSAAGTACYLGPSHIPPPQDPLSKGEQRKVTGCQATLAKQAQQLQGVASKHLARCLDVGLALVLEEDRELDLSNYLEYLQRRSDARTTCTELFEKIGKSSTKMIDQVISRCAPVSGLILTDPTRGDALGVKGFSQLVDLDSVELLAATACGVAISSAEMLVSFTYPRLGNLAFHYYGIDDEDDLLALWHTALDPRCIAPDIDF